MDPINYSSPPYIMNNKIEWEKDDIFDMKTYWCKSPRFI